MVGYNAPNGWRANTNAAIIERASFREEAGPAGRMRYRVVTAVANRLRLLVQLHGHPEA
jgi:hypothetical protein